MAWFARITSGFTNWTLLCESRFGALKNRSRSFEAIRANHSNAARIGVFLRIDLRESICANRPDLRCESLGHLRSRACEVLCTRPIEIARGCPSRKDPASKALFCHNHTDWAADVTKTLGTSHCQWLYMCVWMFACVHAYHQQTPLLSHSTCLVSLLACSFVCLSVCPAASVSFWRASFLLSVDLANVCASLSAPHSVCLSAFCLYWGLVSSMSTFLSICWLGCLIVLLDHGSLCPCVVLPSSLLVRMSTCVSRCRSACPSACTC